MDLSRAVTPEQAATNALAHLKMAGIADFADVPRGLECAKRFGSVRDELLAEVNWSFSWASCRPSRMTDPADGAAPFPYLYAMPEDCVAVRNIPSLGEDAWGVVAALTDAGEESVIIGMKAATPPIVHYTRRVQNVRRWSALFLRIFEYRLAVAIAPVLAGDNSLTNSCLEEAKSLLAPLKRRDAQQKARTKLPRSSSWLDARGI